MKNIRIFYLKFSCFGCKIFNIFEEAGFHNVFFFFLLSASSVYPFSPLSIGHHLLLIFCLGLLYLQQVGKGHVSIS